MFTPMLASLLGSVASPLLSLVTKKAGEVVPNIIPALSGNIGNIIEGGLKTLSGGKAADLINPISKLAIETLDGQSKAFQNPNAVPIPQLAETPQSLNNMIANRAHNINSQLSHIRNNNAANLRPVSVGYHSPDGSSKLAPQHDQFSDNLNNVAPVKTEPSVSKPHTGSEMDTNKKKIPKLRLIRQRK